MRIAFTIATGNYLAQAKALSDSLLKHNPEYQFKIILLDRIQDRFDPEYFAPAEIIEIEDIEIQGFSDMVERYTIFELSNALKPYVADHLLSRLKSRTDSITYFDSDILIFNNLLPVQAALEKDSVVISSHAFSSLPEDGLSCNDKSFLMHGIYNGGFFAVRNDDLAKKFINWWRGKLRHESLVDYSNGLYVDQKWLNFAPLYFKGVNITTHLGLNVGYWNLHERSIEKANHTYLINKEYELIFFHFSGFDVKNPNNVSKHQNRYNFENRPDIKEIFFIYKEAINVNAHEKFALMKCCYKKPVIEDKEDLNNKKDFRNMFRIKLINFVNRVFG